MSPAMPACAGGSSAIPLGQVTTSDAIGSSCRSMTRSAAPFLSLRRAGTGRLSFGGGPPLGGFARSKSSSMTTADAPARSAASATAAYSARAAAPPAAACRPSSRRRPASWSPAADRAADRRRPRNRRRRRRAGRRRVARIGARLGPRRGHALRRRRRHMPARQHEGDSHQRAAHHLDSLAALAGRGETVTIDAPGPDRLLRLRAHALAVDRAIAREVLVDEPGIAGEIGIVVEHVGAAAVPTSA